MRFFLSLKFFIIFIKIANVTKKDTEKMMSSFLQIKKRTDIVFKIIKFTDVCSSLGMCVAP